MSRLRDILIGYLLACLMLLFLQWYAGECFDIAWVFWLAGIGCASLIFIVAFVIPDSTKGQ